MPFSSGARSNPFSALALSFVIWLCVAAVAAQMLPTARHANDTYRTEFFSAYALNLARNLASEARLVSQLSSVNQEPVSSGEIQNQRRSSRSSAVNLQTRWDRFNSRQYGSQFREKIETALKLLSPIETVSLTTGTPKTPVETANDLLAYISPVKELLEALLLANGTRNKEGANPGNATEIEIAYAFENELSAALKAAYAGNQQSRRMDVWNDAVQSRQQLIAGYSASSTRDSSGSANPKDLDRSLKQAIDAGNRFREASSGSVSPPLPELTAMAGAYLDLLAVSINEVHSTSSSRSHKSKLEAENNDWIFSLVVAVASLLTALLLVFRTNLSTQSVFLLVLAIFNIAFVAWRYAAGTEFLSIEAMPLEVTQVVALLIATAIFCNEFAKLEVPARTIALLLAFFCFGLCLRELDVRNFGLPDGLSSHFFGSPRRTFLIAAAAVLSVYAYKRRTQILSMIPRFRTKAAWAFYAWPVPVIVGEIAEVLTHMSRKDGVHGYWATGQFWEELLELNGYLLLVLAALSFRKIVNQKKAVGP